MMAGGSIELNNTINIIALIKESQGPKALFKNKIAGRDRRLWQRHCMQHNVLHAVMLP